MISPKVTVTCAGWELLVGLFDWLQSMSGSLLRVCVGLHGFPTSFPFPFSFPPLSLRGRGATDNTRTTLISHSTVCQSTLTDARARTF